MSAAAPIEMAEDIAGYTHDPSGFARYAFPWGESELCESAGPRKWQQDINLAIAEHLSTPETRFQPCRIAVSSGHGIGKSAQIAMLVVWAMSTCEDCKVVITAGTGTQLATKTVPEVSKWFRLAVNSHWWEINATSIRFRSDKRQANWRSDFITWSDHNTEAFAGLHNQGKRIVVIDDEASAIGDKVWEVTEGALTDENTEIIWLAFGNPTQNTGRFKECFGRFKHRWKTFQIDSRKVEGTNKEQINKWIEDYGEDSDFVRVRVKGEFPRAASNQFIDTESVALCRKYKAEGWDSFPKILGVDVARFGDDQTVLFMRQGRKTHVVLQTRGLSTAQVTDRVAEVIDAENVAGVVVDSDGIGAPVHDQLVARGYRNVLHEFHGGKPANRVNAYFNRRAEVWGLLRDALKAGLEIPDLPELEADLTGPQYGFSSGQQVQLEKKDDMKKRGLSSPDLGDALAMTFAVRIAPQVKHEPVNYAQYGADSWMA